jgi:hypothetical protein
MLTPLSDPGNSGYVPLCAALHWIMTAGGSKRVFANRDLWAAAVDQLWPLITTEEVELIGLAAGASMSAPIPGQSLALMKVVPPLTISLSEALLGAPAFVQCMPFADKVEWTRYFNDKLYQPGRADPTWTHLQVRKSQILDRWQKPQAKVLVERDCCRWLVEQMRASPNRKTKSRNALMGEARRIYPSLAVRQFRRAWDRAIAESGAYQWAKAGAIGRKSKRRSG